jgi:hypothetical protein
MVLQLECEKIIVVLFIVAQRAEGQGLKAGRVVSETRPG